MKKMVNMAFLFLIIVIIILFIGCGKTYTSSGNNVNGNSCSNTNNNSSSLQIVNRSIPIGTEGISSTAAFSVTFNNEISTSEFDDTKLIFPSNHTAGGSNAMPSFTWSADKKTLTVSDYQGWDALLTTTEAPVRVHIADIGAFKDIYGNHLTTGETIVNCLLEIDWSRYWPTDIGSSMQYDLLNKGVLKTDIWRYIGVGSTTQHVSIEEEVNALVAGTFEIKSTNSMIAGTMGFGDKPSDYGADGGIKLVAFPAVTGESNPNYYNVPALGGPVVATYETFGYEYIAVPYGTFHTLVLIEQIGIMGSVIHNKYWLAYNRGPIKYRMIGGMFDITGEAVSYTP